MKLNIDFSRLFKAVEKMGTTPLEDFDIVEITFEDIEVELEKGIEVQPSEIESTDGLLSYKGRQVLLYIPDQGDMIDNVLGNSLNGRRFHISDCKTIEDMKQKNKFDRYIVTNNLNDEFEVTGFSKNQRMNITVETKLHVCKNCLDKLNYNNYRNNKNKIFQEFKIHEFFESYSTLFKHFPKFKNLIYDSDYTTDWKEISKEYRSSKNYVCETCLTSFRENKKLLHTHHKNGVKSDNSSRNLKAVCIDCHRKEPNHEHVLLKERELIEIYTERKKQNTLEINTWDDVLKFADLSLHGYIHLLKNNSKWKLPEVGYIIEKDNKKILLDLAWISANKKAAVVSNFKEEHKSLIGWKIISLNEAIQQVR